MQEARRGSRNAADSPPQPPPPPGAAEREAALRSEIAKLKEENQALRAQLEQSNSKIDDLTTKPVEDFQAVVRLNPDRPFRIVGDIFPLPDLTPRISLLFVCTCQAPRDITQREVTGTETAVTGMETEMGDAVKEEVEGTGGMNKLKSRVKTLLNAINTLLKKFKTTAPLASKAKTLLNAPLQRH